MLEVICHFYTRFSFSQFRFCLFKSTHLFHFLLTHANAIIFFIVFPFLTPISRTFIHFRFELSFCFFSWFPLPLFFSCFYRFLSHHVVKPIQLLLFYFFVVGFCLIILLTHSLLIPFHFDVSVIPLRCFISAVFILVSSIFHMVQFPDA